MIRLKAGTPKAVIFDMDGVLVDSEHHFPRELPAILREFSIEWSDEDGRATLGSNQPALYEYLVQRHHLRMTQDEFLARFGEAVLEHVYRKALLVPGAQQLLADCRRRGLKTALASSSPRAWIDIVIAKFALLQAFDAVVSGTEFRERGKPAPDIFLFTAKQLGLAPSDCVVIEDSRNGVLAAKAAGMYCICLSNPRYNYAVCPEEADMKVTELTQNDTSVP